MNGSRPRRTRIRRMLTFLAVAAGLYGALCIGGRLVHRKLLYPAALGGATPVRIPAGGELLHLRAADGAPVDALDVGPAGPDSGRVLLHFHGNGDTIASGVG